MFTYTNMCTKTLQEIYFIFVENKEIYCIFKTCCRISVLFSVPFYFVILYFSVQIILTFCINCALKRNTNLGRMKVCDHHATVTLMEHQQQRKTYDEEFSTNEKWGKTTCDLTWNARPFKFRYLQWLECCSV